LMKSFTRSLRALFTASLVAAGYAAAQQPPHPQEPQHQHQKPEQNPAQDQSKQEMQHGEHQMTMRTVEPVYPRMGKAQEQAKGPLMTLTSLQRLAAQSNPTLRQAEAEIRAAKARQQQAGLYPNPTVGYTGDEIRGGSVGGGKQGFFVSQPIVTAGKLGKNRQIFGQEIRLAEVEAEEQKMRIESAVRIAFYRVLAAQELLEAQRDLARIAQDNAETEHRLSNTGQADRPAVRIAAISTTRAQAVLERSKAEPVPDLQLRAGAEYFGEQLEGINRSIGWEGIAEVGVTLPLWNRNQGNIAAARQDLDRAQ